MHTVPKILIVDDNDTNLDVLEAVIQSSIKAQLIRANNGKEALSALCDQEIALAILDVNMPGITGFELAEAIHTNEKTKHIPIIFLSADLVDEHNIHTGYTKGAVDYITKPYNSKVLIGKIAVFIDLFQQRKLLEEEINKRRQVEVELRTTQSQLENRVRERTTDLSEANDRLRLEILERKKTLEKLYLNEKKFRSMIEAMQDMAYISDSDYRIVYLNPATVKEVGHDAIGKYCYNAIYGKQEPCSWCAWEQIKKKGYRNYIMQNPTNNRYYKVSNSMIHLEGDLIHKLTIFRDITAEKETENQLDYARRKAEESNRAKSEFLSNISHELRTPLHHVLAYAKFGLDKLGKIPEEKISHFFATILESGENLLYLVNDLLDIAKLESGKFEFVMEYASIEQVLKASIKECLPAFEAKGIILEMQNIEEPTELICDRQRIKQVFQNLLSNAVKFTPSGKRVSISISSEKLTMEMDKDVNDKAPVSNLLIRFKDEGIGIPEGEFETIFDKFIQSSKSRSEAGGTGLGLAICREIVKGHHGALQAEKNPEGGSIFTVILPYIQNK
ncbi:response regulator [bacterium]|nr:response regulator [bacterium]